MRVKQSLDQFYVHDIDDSVECYEADGIFSLLQVISTFSIFISLHFSKAKLSISFADLFLRSDFLILYPICPPN